MRTITSLKALSVKAAVWAALSMSFSAQAASVPPSTDAMQRNVQARFDPLTRQTLVTGRISPDLCFSLDLPQEWRLETGELEPRLKAVLSGAELEVSLRSSQELRDMPQADLASRDAAVLQRDYEELLGRPAQSVSLSSDAGATRWSATWIDANLPTASHAMTVETLILPLSNESVLELSLSGAETEDAYNALVQRMLTGLRVQGRASCQG